MLFFHHVFSLHRQDFWYAFWRISSIVKIASVNPMICSNPISSNDFTRLIRSFIENSYGGFSRNKYKHALSLSPGWFSNAFSVFVATKCTNFWSNSACFGSKFLKSRSCISLCFGCSSMILFILLCFDFCFEYSFLPKKIKQTKLKKVHEYRRLHILYIILTHANYDIIHTSY